MSATHLPLLIGLIGQAGSGKSTIAGYLRKHYGYARTSFASALKHKAEMWYLDNEYEQLAEEGTPEPIIQAYAQIHDSDDFWHKPTPPAARTILQWLGTDVYRAKDPAYWLKSIRIPPGEATVVDDIRFPNEAAYITALGGELWWVVGRRDTTVPPHASEEFAARANGLSRVTINNTGTLDELYTQVDAALAAKEAAPNNGNH